MMREYHYLISSLPELFYDKKGKPLDFDFYLNELKFCLHPDDFNLVKYLLYETDNENLLNLILEKNRPFITGGYFSKDELTNEIKYPNKLPDYMKEFISYY